MAYDLLVGEKEEDLASLNGWKMFKREVKSQMGDALKDFIMTGEADAKELGEAVEELEGLSESSASIQETMLDILDGQAGPAILTDGLVEVDERAVDLTG